MDVAKVLFFLSDINEENFIVLHPLQSCRIIFNFYTFHDFLVVRLKPLTLRHLRLSGKITGTGTGTGTACTSTGIGTGTVCPTI